MFVCFFAGASLSTASTLVAVVILAVTSAAATTQYEKPKPNTLNCETSSRYYYRSFRDSRLKSSFGRKEASVTNEPAEAETSVITSKRQPSLGTEAPRGG